MMTNDNEYIYNAISGFIKLYTEMDIHGVIINCPYWMNKLRAGSVAVRGFANGKGSAGEIRNELITRLNSLSPAENFELTPDNLRKFARRERIGIDCSGFVYRVLDELLRLGYGNTGYKKLEQVFDGGINRTNAKRLTSSQFAKRVGNIQDYKLGDMIRLRNGKHIAVITGKSKNKILYAHASWLSTRIKGVHTSEIQILKADGLLTDQRWMEETRTGENFGEKYFHPADGDGVFRLKIFAYSQTR